MFAAILLLALAPQSLFQGDLAVPRSRARGIPVAIRRPTFLHCQFKTKLPEGQARAALLTAAGVRAYQDGQPYEAFAATAYGASGEFRFLVMRPGEYVVLIDNRYGEKAALDVHVEVTGAEDPSLPRTLPAARKQAVIFWSLGLFALVAGWSGVRLRRATRTPSP